MRIEFKICPRKDDPLFTEEALAKNIGKEVNVQDGWVGVHKGVIVDTRIERGGKEGYIGVELQGKPDKDGEFRTPGQYKAERDAAAWAIPQKRPGTTRNGKSVQIIETGKIYPSQAATARAIGGSQNGVQAFLAGRIRQYKGYTFRYVTEEEQ